MKYLTLVFPFSTVRQRTRLCKLVQVLRDERIVVDTLSWERVKGEHDSELEYPFRLRKRVLVGGGYGTQSRIYYMAWIIKLTFEFLKKPKGTVLYCLGFECALPAYVVSRVRGISYIFDDADRFSMIFSLPRPVQRIVEALESLVSKRSVANIIPGRERYEFENVKQVVLRNSPDSGSVELSKKIPVERPKSSLVVYANGWLGETRGMPTLHSVALKCLDKVDVVFLLAGRVDGRHGELTKDLENVVYLGQLSNAEALAWYRASDLAFTYYDPVIRINRFAESNKWGDCIEFGVVPIVNLEVVTREFLAEGGACIGFDYLDVDRLVDELQLLSKDSEKLSILKRNVDRLKGGVVYFDVGIRKVVNGVL